jgi:N-acetylglucosamine kinase-like BadF-type ATPase
VHSKADETSPILAIEGGGTHTRAWLAAGDALAPRVLAAGSAGPSNFHSVGDPALRAVLAALVGQVAATRGAHRGHRPSLMVLGMAGADSTADRQRVLAAARRACPDTPALVVTDAQAALEGASGGHGGVLLIAGTGSIAYGSLPGIGEARAGGWGPAIGDEGSGYCLGRELLRHAATVLDGRARRDVGFDRLMQHLGLESGDELTAWIRANSGHPRLVAALAPVVVALAAARFPRAVRVVDHAASDLVRMLRSVRQGLSLPEDHRVILYGGLLLEDAYFRSRVRDRLLAEFPRVRMSRGHPDDGLRGCVLVGRRHLREGRFE